MDDIVANVARTADGLTHLNTIVPVLIRLRLFTPFGDPMPGARVRVTLGDQVVAGRADGDAWVEVRTMIVPETCQVEWDDGKPIDYVVDDFNPPASDLPESDPADYTDPAWVSSDSGELPVAMTNPDAYRYIQEVYLQFETDDDEAAVRRLHNLGLTLGETLEANVREFEAAYDKPVTGELGQVKDTLWDWHDNGTLEPCPDPDPPDLT